MTTLHSEPLPTDEAKLFAKSHPQRVSRFLYVFSQEEAKNMPPHHEFDHKIHLENDQTPLHSHIYPLSGTELSLLCEFLNDMLGKGLSDHPSLQQVPGLFVKKKDSTCSSMSTSGTSTSSAGRIGTDSACHQPP